MTEYPEAILGAEVPWHEALKDLGEKTFATWFQAFIVLAIGTPFFDGVMDVSLLGSAALAAVPAALTLLVNAASGASEPVTWPPLGQAVFRVLRTWVVTFLSFLAGGVWVADWTAVRALWVAAVGAAGTAFLAAVKAELARHVGDPATVSLVSTPARGQFG